MKNLPTIINQALKLLRKSPDGAALTVALVGGGDDFVTPSFEKHMIPVLVRTGMRRSETRPTMNLRLYVEQREFGFSASLERITGMAALPTIPDPSEYLASVKADSLEALEAVIVAAIEQTVQVDELSMASLNYRKNKFSAASFEVKEDTRSRFAIFSARPQDITLRNFVADTVGDALRFDGGYPSSSISLWFTMGECLKTIYVTVGTEGGKFAVSAQDRACWPWKEQAIKRVVSTRADVCELIADYIARQYSFRTPAVEVYFNWS